MRVLREVAVVEGEDDRLGRQAGAAGPRAPHLLDRDAVVAAAREQRDRRAEALARGPQLGVRGPRRRGRDHVVHQDRDRPAVGARRRRRAGSAGPWRAGAAWPASWSPWSWSSSASRRRRTRPRGRRSRAPRRPRAPRAPRREHAAAGAARAPGAHGCGQASTPRGGSQRLRRRVADRSVIAEQIRHAARCTRAAASAPGEAPDTASGRAEIALRHPQHAIAEPAQRGDRARRRGAGARRRVDRRAIDLHDQSLAAPQQVRLPPTGDPRVDLRLRKPRDRARCRASAARGPTASAASAGRTRAAARGGSRGRGASRHARARRRSHPYRGAAAARRGRTPGAPARPRTWSPRSISVRARFVIGRPSRSVTSAGVEHAWRCTRTSAGRARLPLPGGR